jgi:hypothetical protein
MKRIAVCVAAVVMVGGAMAQDSGFSVGLDLAMPLGNTADLYSFGVGPVVQYEREAGSSGLLGASVAYTIMFPKDDLVKSGAIIPLQVQYKYFFGGDVREGLYVGFMFGYGIQTVTTEDITAGPVTVEGGTESNAGLALAPVIGYWLNERIDLGLRYQLIATSDSNDGTVSSSGSSQAFPYIGFRATYAF